MWKWILMGLVMVGLRARPTLGQQQKIVLPEFPTGSTSDELNVGFFTPEKSESSYRLFLNPTTWRKAFKHCQQWHSHLVVIDSKREFEDIHKLVEEFEQLGLHNIRKMFHAGYHQLYNRRRLLSIFGNDVHGFLHYDPSLSHDDELLHPQRERCMGLTYGRVDLVPIDCEIELLPFVCEKCIRMEKNRY